MNNYCECPVGHCSDVHWKGSQARGRLVCPCGSESFLLFKRKKSAEEELGEVVASKRLHDDYWPFGPVFARDKNGKAVVRSEFFGIKWKERPFSDYEPSVLSFQYVSARCEKCGKEIVLYDERRNPLAKEGSMPKYGELGEIKWGKTPCGAECVIDCNGFDGNACGFERLRIYKTAGGKKSLFFDHET